jgi:hypothetical protein
MKLMNLDNIVPGRYRDKAVVVLRAGGFDRASLELVAESTLRILIWTLGGANPRRRKLALELLAAVVEDESEAA